MGIGGRTQVQVLVVQTTTHGFASGGGPCSKERQAWPAWRPGVDEMAAGGAPPAWSNSVIIEAVNGSAPAVCHRPSPICRLVAADLAIPAGRLRNRNPNCGRQWGVS